ncbi:hypothetical protein [Methylobacterium platani]|uniref:Uncharacterized protein n=2 Tax=Methylobacterium platani TaxID=427683 RepID=A0A179S2X0_9HYPH|nr:hypothetical protein [Methylobacterium platani]KMO13911.1 hypothetical protein SQ03_20595 [Methylobacterium platani JCM 14648]OAS20028.1 hypothetical protein A5481_23235 [Methylobacterium platani]
MLRPHFFLGITVPAAFLALVGQPLIEHSVEALARPAGVEQAAIKGDRLALVRPAAKAQVPVAVEITGLGAAKVILRNAAGDVVYQADTTRNTTLVARDTALPHVTVRERAGSPVAQREPAAASQTGRRMLEGCEGAISGLAGHEARRLLPSRCVADAGDVVPATLSPAPVATL